jgi:hypothetical protein
MRDYVDSFQLLRPDNRIRSQGQASVLAAKFLGKVGDIRRRDQALPVHRTRATPNHDWSIRWYAEISPPRH